MPEVIPFRKPTAKDAGDEASTIRFRHGATGSLVVITVDNQYHIGTSGMSPLQIRDIACRLIAETYKV